MRKVHVHVRELDHTNKELVRKVKVKPGQEQFIETVDECLQEAATYYQWHPVAINADGRVVGFAMYGSFGANKDTWIDRIIIDEQEQGKGLGKKAMRELMDIVPNEYGVSVLYLSIIEENKVARRLYESLGFEYIHEKDPNGELIFKWENEDWGF